MELIEKWISNLMHGDDSELSGARKTMDTKLSRLQNATEFAILGNTEELQRMSRDLQQNQQSHNAMLEEQREVMASIQDTTRSIHDDMTKLLKAFSDTKKPRDKEAVKAQESSKPPSARRIRNVLPDVQDPLHEYRLLKEIMVPDTCTWIFSEPGWETWINDPKGSQRPLLAVTGGSGMGKSHLAVSIYDHLQQQAREDDEKNICVAHYYFREQHMDLRQWSNALITIINQVVEQNAMACDVINAKYLADEVSLSLTDWRDLARNLLSEPFKEGSNGALFIVLDGLDEMLNIPEFLEFCGMITEGKWKVSVIFTARTSILPQLSEAKLDKIEITKEKQLEDLKAFIWQKIRTLKNLRLFSRYVKQRIADRCEECPSKYQLYHFGTVRTLANSCRFR